MIPQEHRMVKFTAVASGLLLFALILAGTGAFGAFYYTTGFTECSEGFSLKCGHSTCRCVHMDICARVHACCVHAATFVVMSLVTIVLMLLLSVGPLLPQKIARCGICATFNKWKSFYSAALSFVAASFSLMAAVLWPLLIMPINNHRSIMQINNLFCDLGPAWPCEIVCSLVCDVAAVLFLLDYRRNRKIAALQSDGETIWHMPQAAGRRPYPIPHGQ